MKFSWLAVLLLAGCAAIPTPAFEARKLERALVNWRHGADSLTADVVFQQSETGARQLIVSKGATLLVITQIGAEWVATGALARGGWRGPVSRAPGPLASWICLAESDRGQGSSFQIECAATGDRFRVIF